VVDSLDDIAPHVPRSRKVRSASRATIHLPGPAAVASPIRSSLCSRPTANRRTFGSSSTTAS
jgi:hypothetical protein